MTARALYISDYAYAKLITLAQRQRYVPYGSSRVKGIGEFLEDIAHKEFVDTRPPLVRERHEQELRYNRAPVWLHNRRRRSRLIKLSDGAVARLFKIAFLVGIIREEPFIIGGPSRTNPLPSVAYVVESIGLGWITPDVYPIGQK
jgi:hypothetical protein